MPGCSVKAVKSRTISSVPRFSALLKSHSAVTRSRARKAAKVVSAITARPVGICMTSTTPATARAAVASNAISLPPKRGECLMTATFILGRRTSIVNIAVPFTLAGTSILGTRVPISVNCDGSFNATPVGTSSLPAASASSPKAALLPDAWLTTPLLTVISAAGTLHCLAAAATSMALAVAPTVRYCIQAFGTLMEPPVPWMPSSRWRYSATLAGAASTRICDQSASSSSAIIVARPVYTP